MNKDMKLDDPTATAPTGTPLPAPAPSCRCLRRDDSVRWNNEKIEQARRSISCFWGSAVSLWRPRGSLCFACATTLCSAELAMHRQLSDFVGNSTLPSRLSIPSSTNRCSPRAAASSTSKSWSSWQKTSAPSGRSGRGSGRSAGAGKQGLDRRSFPSIVTCLAHCKGSWGLFFIVSGSGHREHCQC